MRRGEIAGERAVITTIRLKKSVIALGDWIANEFGMSRCEFFEALILEKAFQIVDTAKKLKKQMKAVKSAEGDVTSECAA